MNERSQLPVQIHARDGHILAGRLMLCVITVILSSLSTREMRQCCNPVYIAQTEACGAQIKLAHRIEHQLETRNVPFLRYPTCLPHSLHLASTGSAIMEDSSVLELMQPHIEMALS